MELIDINFKLIQITEEQSILHSLFSMKLILSDLYSLILFFLMNDDYPNVAYVRYQLRY